MEIMEKIEIKFRCKCGKIAVATIYSNIDDYDDDYESIEICEDHVKSCIEMGIKVKMY